MPIFEYRCNSCNKKFDVLHKSTVKEDDIVCPSCGSTNNKKLFSAFSSQVSGNSSSFGCENGACASAPHQHSGGCCGGACGMN